MQKSIKKFSVIPALMAIGSAGLSGQVLFSDDFDSYSSNGDFVDSDNSGVLFDPSGTSEVAVGQWARGTFQTEGPSLVDLGGGDNAIVWDGFNISYGFAILLDVSSLGLSTGTDYEMNWTISDYTNSQAGSTNNGFGNVVKASGVDAGGTVSWDLASGANFDATTSAGGALLGTGTGNTNHTSRNPSAANTGSIAFTAAGSYSKTFNVSAGDEYVGLIIGVADRNQGTTSMTLDNVSIAVVPEPSSAALILGLASFVVLFSRRTKLAE